MKQKNQKLIFAQAKKYYKKHYSQFYFKHSRIWQKVIEISTYIIW